MTERWVSLLLFVCFFVFVLFLNLDIGILRTQHNIVTVGSR